MEHDRIVIQRRAGRPRDEEAHRAILDATMQLLREVGLDALAIEAVAARAGVGKATIYRWWSTKEALAAEAAGRIVRSLPTPDTGSTRSDLLALMRDTVRLYADPGTLGLLSGLVAAMARSEAIAAAVRGGFHAARTEAHRVVLHRGVARGEIRECDVELAIELLNGPLFYRFLWTGNPVDDRTAAAVVDAVLRGVQPT